MIYDIRQVTRYIYGETIASSRHLIRMQPCTRANQTVLQSALHIEPPPSEWAEDYDFFGNRIVRIAYDTPHEALTVTVTARMAVAPLQAGEAMNTPSWEEIVAAALKDRDAGPHGPAQFLFSSRMVALDATLTAYAAESFSPARPVLAAAQDLNHRLHADFIYDTAATSVDTDPVHAFHLRRGVCQDFAHIMIAGLRGLGIPAAYISGWLRTVPPPGEARLEGADATHAWIAVWCGPCGWIGLDPTNGIAAGVDHVILAIGRDYADIAPLDGVIWSGAEHSLSVAVDVVPVDDDHDG